MKSAQKYFSDAFFAKAEGRPRTRWEDSVEEDIRKTGIRFVEDRIQCALILVQANDHFGL